MRKHCPQIPFTLACGQFDLRLLHLRTPLPADVEQMAASLKKHGQLAPVVAAGDERAPILIDGFKRHRAARLLGLPTLSVVFVAVEPLQIKALTYLMNRGRGFTLLQEALLVRELVEIDGFNQSEAASIVERHKSWVSRRLELIRQLTPEVSQELALGLLPAGSASALARLPRCNQADFSVTIQTHGLSATEIRRLVELWCKSKEPALRQFLLDAPCQALAIADERQDSGPAEWQRLLQAIMDLIRDLDRRLRRQTPGGTDPTALLHATEQQVLSGFARLKLHLAGGSHE